MRRVDIWTVFTLTVCCVCVCVLLDCKIQLLFQFSLLFDILNQCDNLMFRHFLFSPFLSAYSSAVLPASRLMLPLRLSFLALAFSLPPFLSGATPSSATTSILPRHLSLHPYLHFSDVSPHHLPYTLTLCLAACWFFHPSLHLSLSVHAEDLPHSSIVILSLCPDGLA